jgi:hypothetical protein
MITYNLEQVHKLEQQKNQAYSERNKVVAALAKFLRRSNILDPYNTYHVGVAQHDVNDTSWETDWRTILVIEINDIQMTWHFHDSEKYLLEGFPLIPDYKWDGHSTEEKYNRLLKFCGINILEAQE